MENMNIMDEMDLSPAEQVIMDQNLARTKGFLLGAIVVGAGVGAVCLFKKFKKRKTVVEVVDQETEA